MTKDSPTPTNAAITALSPQPKDPNVRRVFVNGRQVARLRAADVDELGLEEGTVWTAALAADVERRAGVARARRAALTMLGRRDYTSSELRARLERAGHDREITSEVIRALIDDEWINDERAAADYVASMLDKEPLGRPVIVARLDRRGIDRALAERVAARALEDRDALADAEAFARRRLARMSGAGGAGAARRIAGLLARRGFDDDTVGTVLSRLHLMPEA